MFLENTVADVKRLTKLNDEDQSFLLRYVVRLPLECRIEIMSQHRRILFMLKENNKEMDISNISYVAYILAIKSFYGQEKKLSQKKFDDMSLEEIVNLSLISIKKFENKLPSSTPKRDKLVHYWAVVKVLKQRGMSFRSISKFLKKEYRFEVGHSLVHMTWNELEINNYE